MAKCYCYHDCQGDRHQQRNQDIFGHLQVKIGIIQINCVLGSVLTMMLRMTMGMMRTRTMMMRMTTAITILATMFNRTFAVYAQAVAALHFEPLFATYRPLP